MLTGNSRLVKDDYGTLILTGANSYTGGTTIAGGTLQIGDVGTSGSITGDVLNNGLLRFSRTDATSFGGLISGSGAVHVAHGQLTLTGNNTYAGETTIGSIASLTLGDGTPMFGLTTAAIKVGTGESDTLSVPVGNPNANTPAGSSVLWDAAKSKTFFEAMKRGEGDLKQYA